MTNSDNFHHALQTANRWLADVAREFGTRDRRFAYRVLRAWLHTLRDRLTVESTAKFSSQLPELLRGVYYDGWEPHKVPVKYGPEEYVRRFAYEARIPVDEVRPAAASVASAIATHLSRGQLEVALAQLPEPLRTMIAGPAPPPAAPETVAEAAEAAEGQPDRITALEKQVNNVAEALRTLAEGLEDSPLTGVDQRRRGARAARLASEILMAAPVPQPEAAPTPEASAAL